MTSFNVKDSSESTPCFLSSLGAPCFNLSGLLKPKPWNQEDSKRLLACYKHCRSIERELEELAGKIPSTASFYWELSLEKVEGLKRNVGLVAQCVRMNEEEEQDRAIKRGLSRSQSCILSPPLSPPIVVVEEEEEAAVDEVDEADGMAHSND